MTFWDDKSVTVMNRVDVKNSDHFTVLVQNLGRNLVIDDPTEYTIHDSYSVVSKTVSLYREYGRKGFF